MKIKLTEKFSIKRKGDVIDVSEVTAEMLIAEGKAEATKSKAEKGGKGKDAEKQTEQAPEADEPANEPEAPNTNDVVIE